jgi:hypothetical protein
VRRTFVRRSAAVAVAFLIVSGVLAATSEAAFAATAPTAPTGLTVRVGHYGLAELHWNVPSSDGGSSVLDYVVQTSPETDCSDSPLGAPQSQCVVEYGVTYTFSVAAQNAIGTSSPSSEVAATPVPMLLVSDASVVEGNSGVRLGMSTVVSLDGPSQRLVSVFYSTGNGTATTGTDYGRKLGLINFAPGETKATVNVAVNGDTLYEGNETMRLALSAPTNAVFRKWVGIGTIVNDDAAPSVSIADTTQVERNVYPPLTHMRFTVSLSTLTGVRTKIAWSTSAGTATPGTDYVPTGGSVVIAAGKLSASIVVPVVPDRLREPNEALFVQLVTAQGATIGRAVAQGTIINDD